MPEQRNESSAARIGREYEDERMKPSGPLRELEDRPYPSAAQGQDQDVETLRAILCCYEADGKTEGGTAGMLTLRQAQLGREALDRIEQRLGDE